ncbi:hypothetical protein GCM10010329_77910 [Streptomyces spiroverticillatus]|uniref:Uncharacterized protein n=1 Tax=Streptomyces finlayi TaxID=67296 RepID=A0A919CDR2_9ACTN|nr:hypothetical protein [Streptomyces finlayi]GHA43455.1 hypothetical protein GCM10010329_77910 [Streptomyces spiroverticillatus]GHD13371.1 hypothetical protein GCM10010334_71440 [Streptomyces finlayi]
MITLTETLAVRSVPGFLDPKEIAFLTGLLDDHLAATGWSPAYVGEELDDLPPRVQEVLDAAVARHLPQIQQVFPSAVGTSPWQYIEFGPGEGAVRHLDGIGPDPLARPRHVARIGVSVEDAVTGGEFFIETAPSDGIWDTRLADGPHRGYEPGMRFTRIAPHDKISRGEQDTSWIHTVTGHPDVLPADTGTATVYGAQLIHGIRPVGQGRCRKFITGLLADQ